MSAAAPVRVPIEISPATSQGPVAGRVFKLAHSVAVDRVLLGSGLPDEPDWLAGPLHLQFHLPGDPAPVLCRARAAEVVVDLDTEHERAERRALLLDGLPPEAAARIERYVEERLTAT